MTKSTFGMSAYGGENWSQRHQTHGEEIGTVWGAGQINSEWRQLTSVMLHCPGDELLTASGDPDGFQMLAAPDPGRAREEHAAMAETYTSLGVSVHAVMPDDPCPPNQMFVADLFVMTPEGAIIARPASTVRAGEERWIARRLAALGVPILKTLTGAATFEGADFMWIDESTAMIGRGHRTNEAAIEQIRTVLSEIGCDLVVVDMPFGTMHLMGMLRILDKDLAICWSRRTPYNAVRMLEEKGYQVRFPPFEDDQPSYRGINFVTLGPRKILMVSGLPVAQDFYEGLGVDCITTPTDELSLAAGNVGCLTGVIERDMYG